MFLILFFIIKMSKNFIETQHIRCVSFSFFNQRRNDSIDYIVKARYSFLAMKS